MKNWFKRKQAVEDPILAQCRIVCAECIRKLNDDIKAVEEAQKKRDEFLKAMEQIQSKRFIA